MKETHEENQTKKSSGDTPTCPFCGKDLIDVGVICKCEIAPKYDADYEEWKNK